MDIRFAYTPNADDAYMTFGLMTNAVAGNLDFKSREGSLAALNDAASRGESDVTMFSAAAWPLLKDHYRLCAAGASFAHGGTGPVIVAREPFDEADLKDKIIAIPGATTTAYVMLQLYRSRLKTRILPLNKLLPAVQAGLVDCVLAIHEEFVTYSQYGLHVVLDLSQWWAETFDHIPMPVTCCGINRALPEEVQQEAANMIARSITYAHEHHAEAMDHAMQYAADTDREQIEEFIAQYVNELSVNMGPAGRNALEQFFELTAQRDILPTGLPLEFVETA